MKILEVLDDKTKRSLEHSYRESLTNEADSSHTLPDNPNRTPKQKWRLISLIQKAEEQLITLKQRMEDLRERHSFITKSWYHYNDRVEDLATLHKITGKRTHRKNQKRLENILRHVGGQKVHLDDQIERVREDILYLEHKILSYKVELHSVVEPRIYT